MIRFGSARKLESVCEREYGAAVLDSFHHCSLGLSIPVPIMGIGAAAYRGTIIARKPHDLSYRIRKNTMRNLVHSERGGFASLGDLISEATTGGKQQNITFNKVGAAPGAVAGTSPLWNVGNMPAAGGVGGTSGTGSVPTRATTGALAQTNAAGGDSLHLVSAQALSTVVGSILIYDRLWHMTYNHATATSTAVDAANRPTRYTTTNAAGNFVTSEVTTVLSATAHNLGVTYVDENNNTAEANTQVAVRVSSAVQTILFTAPQWTHTLNSPDFGARYLTNINQSTITSVTGVSSFVLGHPLALVPIPVANMPGIIDNVNSMFNMIQILDNACVSFMDFQKSANTAATINGIITLVSG